MAGYAVCPHGCFGDYASYPHLGFAVRDEEYIIVARVISGCFL